MARQQHNADWDQLLQQSEDFATRDAEGFPRVERDLLQVEHFSQKLRAKVARADHGEDAFAATRLLAQEGLNNRRYTQELAAFELKPTYEDVFQVESSTVEEYLQQVHEMTVITAIQDAQAETASQFEDFMAECNESEWAAAKRQLFDAILPGGGGAGAATGRLDSMSLYPGRSPAAFASPFDRSQNGATGAANSRSAPIPQLSGRAAGYAQAVCELNQAVADMQPFDAVAAVSAACSDEPPREGVSILRCWQLLSAVLSTAKDIPVSNHSRRKCALIRGSRRYLERGHDSYMQAIIQQNRSEAALGGLPTRLGQVQAFLRVLNRDCGPLDFDQAGAVDTCWQRLYFCLRSGFHEEALQIAEEVKDSVGSRAGSFQANLQEWIASDGQLPSKMSAALTLSCEQLMRDKGARTRQPLFKYKLAVYVVLSGDRRAAEQLLREAGTLFPSIEDFLWFQLSLVRISGRPADGGSPAAQHPSGHPVDHYTLEALQQYLQQYPASHYSRQGQEPLLYVTVLLLSLQFRAAVVYMAQDPGTKAYRLDAVHLAIALLHHQLLDVSSQDAGGRGGVAAVDAGELVHLYGRDFLGRDPRMALEYYMLAARAAGDSLPVKGRLLRELLTESKAYGFILGSGGAGGEGGALARFVPDSSERMRLIQEVAHACARAAQMEEAVELFLYAGLPRPALHILNQQMSDLTELALEEPSAEEQLEGIIRRASAAAAALEGTGDEEDQHELETFSQLRIARSLLQAHRRCDWSAVLQRLVELPFIPEEMHRVQICAATVRTMHPAVADRLPRLLLAAAPALAAQRQAGPLRALVSFAGAVPFRVPQDVLRELNRIYNALA